MAEVKNLIVNGVARVNGDLYVSDNIYGTASNAISAAYAPFTNTDRYVNTASFASTGSKGANGVKMTLTRAGADTGTVVATIPVASATAAGVMTGAQVTNLSGAVASASVATNAMSWITANSSSALTKYHPLSGSLTAAFKAGGVTSSAEYEVSGAAGKNQYYKVTGNLHSIGFGIGIGNVNRGIYQFATGSGGVGKTGWLLLWDNTYTASFLTGYKVKANGFIGALQGNATSATRLVAASGGAYQPVYLSASGVPKACSGYVVTAAQTASWIAAATLVNASASAWKTDTDRYVNTASFASTGSNGVNGVKMTLTRAGSDTATVTATIPVVSATAAGVVTGAQFKKWETGSNWVGANSASFTRVVASASSATTALNWITNNSSSALSTTASCLGVAANTSASVAAAINAKWTYSEATIKAVKVNNATAADSATSATKLVGTSGSLGIPVYVNSGVPTACNANIVSLPLSSSGATTGTLTLVPGKVHKCGTLTGDLTLALGTDNTYTHEAIYCCVFNMGATVRTITLPSGVKVMENSVDLDTADCDYEINIMNNVAVIARTEE